MLRKSDFEADVREVQKAMDSSADTAGAIRSILFAVYLKGVRFGAVEGYNVGVKDGRVGNVEAGRKTVGDSVHSRATRALSDSVVEPRRVRTAAAE